MLNKLHACKDSALKFIQVRVYEMDLDHGSSTAHRKDQVQGAPAGGRIMSSSFTSADESSHYSLVSILYIANPQQPGMNALFVI